ncbi:MAG: hypothetical protein M3066_00730, partial [Actinomycetota bacterium]|nr:hypothetical protein [Actinomycetota bacterium]
MTDLLVIPATTAPEPAGAGSDPDPAAPAAPRRRRFRRLRRILRSRLVRVVLALVFVAAVVVGRSVALTLTAPGTDSAAARLSIWARDHRLGALVNLGERLTYKPPKVGGQPAQGIRPAVTGVREVAAATAAGP